MQALALAVPLPFESASCLLPLPSGVHLPHWWQSCTSETVLVAKWCHRISVFLSLPCLAAQLVSSPGAEPSGKPMAAWKAPLWLLAFPEVLCASWNSYPPGVCFENNPPLWVASALLTPTPRLQGYILLHNSTVCGLHPSNNPNSGLFLLQLELWVSPPLGYELFEDRNPVWHPASK